MTWEIVVGLTILVGSLISLGGILVKLVRTLTRLDLTLSAIDKSVSEDRIKNENEHKEIRDELKDHEKRITTIELKKE